MGKEVDELYESIERYQKAFLESDLKFDQLRKDKRALKGKIMRLREVAQALADDDYFDDVGRSYATSMFNIIGEIKPKGGSDEGT